MTDSSVTHPTTYPERPERVWAEGRRIRALAEGNGDLLLALDVWINAIAEGRYRVLTRQYDDLSRIEEQIEHALDVLTARASDAADRRAAEREAQPRVWTAHTTAAWWASLDGETWYATDRPFTDADAPLIATWVDPPVIDLGEGQSRTSVRFSFARRWLTDIMLAEIHAPAAREEQR